MKPVEFKQQNTIKEMVLGFLFSEDKRVVALILKNKPDWQRGLLNGIGGKIEQGETPEQAMVREFEEETGVKINEWKRFALMQGLDWKVYCFKSFSDAVWEVQSTTDENVFKVYVHLLPFNSISNIGWLVSMALDCNDDFIGMINYQPCLPVEKQIAAISQEEIDKAIDEYAFRVPYDDSNKFYNEEALKHFRAGIDWVLNKQLSQQSEDR